MKKQLLAAMPLFLSAVLSFTSCGDDIDYEKNYNEKEVIIDDDGVPDGSPGTRDMIGYYSSLGVNSDLWNYYKSEADAKMSNKDVTSWGSIHYGGPALRIVDDHTIYCVYEDILAQESRFSGEDYCFVVEEKEYSFTYVYRTGAYYDNRYAHYYLYHTIGTNLWTDELRWEGRYSMRGNTIVVQTDRQEGIDDNGRKKGYVFTFSYKDGAIVSENSYGNTVTYVKIK